MSAFEQATSHERGEAALADDREEPGNKPENAVKTALPGE